MSGEKPEESVPPAEAVREEAEQAQSSSQTNASYDAEKTEQLMAMMEKLAMLNQQNGGLPVRNMETALGKKYQFWDTQPMPKFTENPTENTWIEPNVPVDKVRAEPYSLPSAFLWSDVDLNNEAQLEELYQLLTENYVEDDDNMFRFDYSKDFLRWALLVPGWRPEWHIGVRAQQSGRLVAFISAIPQAIRVYDLERKMVEINFLCVHKKLRSKRVAPVLIREVTRRVNLTGVFQAAFTAGAVLPKPVGICRYWHRSLNPKKLIDVRFSHLAKNMTIARTMKLYKLPDSPSVALRAMEKRDVGQAHVLLADHLKQYKLAPHFTKKEFEHIFLPRDNVVYSYVLEKENRVTDFVSFYSLPSSVMNHPQHKTLRAAYSYYWVAGSVPIKQLMNDALILANKEGFDVFNALDLMHNSEVLEELKFGIGDGNLQYYIYNWKCPEMQPDQIGLVLQ